MGKRFFKYFILVSLPLTTICISIFLLGLSYLNYMANFLTKQWMAEIHQDFHQGPRGSVQPLMLSANISAILSFVRKVAM